MDKLLPRRKEPSLHDLLYKDEHISCFNYRSSNSVGFNHFHCQPSDKIVATDLPHNSILFVNTGRVCMQNNDCNEQIITAGEMILIPKATHLRGEVLEESDLVSMVFDLPLNNCDKLRFESYVSICEQIVYDFRPTPLKHALLLFVEQLIYYLRNGLNCVHLHDAKHQEFFILLKAFYSREEIAYLFHPIIGKSMVFRNMILANATKNINVNELILLSKMGKTQFYIQFKTEFGETAKQWLLKQKLRNIKYEASKPEITVKELMNIFEFDTPSGFVQFCRLHFGCTPSELILKVKTPSHSDSPNNHMELSSTK